MFGKYTLIEIELTILWQFQSDFASVIRSAERFYDRQGRVKRTYFLFQT